MIYILTNEVSAHESQLRPWGSIDQCGAGLHRGSKQCLFVGEKRQGRLFGNASVLNSRFFVELSYFSTSRKVPPPLNFTWNKRQFIPKRTPPKNELFLCVREQSLNRATDWSSPGDGSKKPKALDRKHVFLYVGFQVALSVMFARKSMGQEKTALFKARTRRTSKPSLAK